MKRVIVIAAHPDDEVLGCGGTLLKHIKNGDEVAWLIVTSISEYAGFSNSLVESRHTEIEKIKELMDFSYVFQLGIPTMSLDSSSINSLIPKVSKIFNQFKPEIIYVMNRSDAHSDHRIVFDAVFACTKSFRYPYIKRVLMYECISETEFAPALTERIFQPNYFVDITDHLSKKLEMMKVYESELGEHPFPRSIDNITALAHFRGATIGVKFAEAFQLLKFIDK